MTKEKITHPITRAALAIAALILIAIFANWLVALLSVGSRGIDFTENKAHTLQEGTMAILSDLDAPVTIRYYATRKAEAMPRELKLYMRRVDDVLREYQRLANGKLRVEYLDPEPDTDAEDSANLDGISGQRISQDESLYFGIAVSCLDQTATIPFLDPRDETMLEYRLSSAIAEVTRTDKPVVAIMSGLPIAGGPPTMPGQPAAREWMIHQQISRSFETRDLGMNPEKIDPEIDVLLVVHPVNITPAAQFAIDQYLLHGGTVIACLDAFSVSAQMAGGGNPMMGMGGSIPTSSTLPDLLGAWGVKFESGMVIADTKFRTAFPDGRIGVGILTLPQAAMPQKDNVITRDLVDLYFVLPGGFTKTGGKGISANTLVKTSNEACPVNAMKASRLDPDLITSMRPKGKSYDLALHLSGKFKSAFPKGKPGEETSTDKDAKAKDKKDADKPKWLKQATETGNVFLIADVDFLNDNFAYSIRNLGNMQVATPANGNSSLLLNLLDQATGSKHLIGARSRATSRRPFTVIQDMESQFEREVGRQKEQIDKNEEDAVKKLNDLEAQKSRSNGLLSPEQKAEIKKYRAQKVSFAKQRRELQKDLKRRKNKLATSITLLNILVVPAVVILLGLGVFLSRRTATRAR